MKMTLRRIHSLRSLCKLLIATSVMLALLAGCAHVTFHSDPELTQKTGLKYYTAKPYLLVSFTGSKDSPVKIDVISLPDLEHPTYVVYHPGWGQHILNLAVGTNGTLSSYGQTADSKGPETISALASLLGSVGTSASGVGTAVTAFKKQSQLLDPVKTPIENTKGDLRGIITMPPDPNGLVNEKARKAQGFVDDLDRVIK